MSWIHAMRPTPTTPMQLIAVVRISTAHEGQSTKKRNYITVFPPNSLFLGPGLFRESEIRELKIFTYSIIFLPIHYIIMVKSQIQQFSSQFTISLW